MSIHLSLVSKFSPSFVTRRVLSSSSSSQGSTGYGVVLDRVANVILSVTDRHPSKVLVSFPYLNQQIIKNLGSISHIELSGVSLTPKKPEIDFLEERKLTVSEYVDESDATTLPFKGNTFTIAAHIFPVERVEYDGSNDFARLQSPNFAPSVTQFLNILNKKGILIYGAPEGLWHDLSMDDALRSVDEGDVMLVQKIDVPISAINESSDSSSSSSDSGYLRYDGALSLSKKLPKPAASDAAVNNDSTQSLCIKYIVAVIKKQ